MVFVVDLEARAGMGLEEDVVGPRLWWHNQEALNPSSRFRVECAGALCRCGGGEGYTSARSYEESLWDVYSTVSGVVKKSTFKRLREKCRKLR